MSTHPYIPLYVDDYEGATAHLSAEEDGVYNRLLRLCWRTPGCSLPVDDAWIARKIRLTPEDYERVARVILAEFFKVSRGRYIQKRLKDEYDDISRKKSARQQAGKKGGIAKARKEKENSDSNATVLPPDTRAFPNPEPNPEPDKKNHTDSAGATNADLDRLEAKLRHAAGNAIGVSPSLLVLAPVLALLRSGDGPPCDLDADVLPAIRARAAKAKPGSVQSWAYFRDAIIAARDLRLAGAGKGEAPVKVPVSEWSADRWRAALRMHGETGSWSETIGPKPGCPGCRAPPEILAEFGFETAPLFALVDDGRAA